MIVSSKAKAIIVALSLLLLLPVGLHGLQSTQSLVKFHNRALGRWPNFVHDRRNPALYFDRINHWVSDRVYPIVALNRIKNSFIYYVLRQSPSPNITIAPGGLIFLNGSDAEHENNLVSSSCVQASDPANLLRFEAALRRISAYGKAVGTPTDVLMVPTIPVLYGDRLPRSLASSLRDACLASFARQGPVSAIHVPAGMHFVYPFADLKALRDDLAMYPSGNYHADGLSVRIASNAFLRSIGATSSNTPMVLSDGPSEALETRSLEVIFPLYRIEPGDSAPDDDVPSALTEATFAYRDDPGQVISLYRNPAAPNSASILILSDSFGTHQAVDLSYAFQSVAQMQTPHRDTRGMIDDIRRLMHVDRILFVFNDTNLGRLSEFAERLSMPAGVEEP